MQLLHNDGKLWEDFQKALIDAFPGTSDLQQMVRFGINESLEARAGRGDLYQVTYNLIEWVEAQARTDELLLAARNHNPGNPKLHTFAEKVQLASRPDFDDRPGEVEQLVLKSGRFDNVEAWRETMNLRELTVCRVEVPERNGVGTGFLVGPNLAITNYHVLESVINQRDLHTNVVLRFDFKVAANGTTTHEGKTYRLVDGSDWLVDSSLVAALDYALVRVDGEPGRQPVGGQRGAPARAWLAPQSHEFEMNEPIFVLQHPLTLPLKISSGAVINIVSDRQRIIHNVSTEPGSSGSPCFSAGWDLVALHHYGSRTGNTAIMFSAILTQPKVKAALGG